MIKPQNLLVISRILESDLNLANSSYFGFSLGVWVSAALLYVINYFRLLSRKHSDLHNWWIIIFLLSGQSVHYMCSQYLADSSLSEDVSQYDFSTPIQVILFIFNFSIWVIKYCANFGRIFFLLLSMRMFFVGLFSNWRNSRSIQT